MEEGHTFTYTHVSAVNCVWRGGELGRKWPLSNCPKVSALHVTLYFSTGPVIYSAFYDVYFSECPTSECGACNAHYWDNTWNSQMSSASWILCLLMLKLSFFRSIFKMASDSWILVTLLVTCYFTEKYFLHWDCGLYILCFHIGWFNIF